MWLIYLKQYEIGGTWESFLEGLLLVASVSYFFYNLVVLVIVVWKIYRANSG